MKIKCKLHRILIPLMVMVFLVTLLPHHFWPYSLSSYKRTTYILSLNKDNTTVIDHVVVPLVSNSAFDEGPTRTFYACVSRNVCINRQYGVFVLSNPSNANHSVCPPVHVTTRHSIDTDPSSLYTIPYYTELELTGSIMWERNVLALVIRRFWPYNFYHALVNDFLSTMATWRLVHAYARNSENDQNPVLQQVPYPHRAAQAHVLFLDHHRVTSDSNIRIWNETGFKFRQAELQHDTTTCYDTAIIGNGNMDTQFDRTTRLVQHDVNVARELMWTSLGLPVPSSGIRCKTCPISTTLIARTQYRRILNVDALTQLLHSHGFEPRVMTFSHDTPLREQAREWLQAECVVAMHGAELAYVPFMAPRSAVVELFMYNFLAYTYLSLAQASSQYYHVWINPSRDRAHIDTSVWPVSIQTEYFGLDQRYRDCLFRHVSCAPCLFAEDIRTTVKKPSTDLCTFLRMYQDTVIDLTAIAILLAEVRRELR